LEEKKKNFFMRHKVLSVILVLIVIGVIGQACGDDKSATNSANQNSKNNNSTKTTNTKPKTVGVKKSDSLEKLISKNFEDSKLILDKTNSILTIQFNVPHTNENNFVTQMLYKGEDGIEKVYKNEELKKYKTVRLEGMADFTDQYGKTTNTVGMRLTFPQSELQKVQSFNDVTSEQFILLQGENKTYLHPAVKKNIKPEILQKVFPNE
jgi:hypothetical protein